MAFIDLPLYRKYVRHIIITELIHLVIPALIFSLFTKHSNEHLFHSFGWTLNFDAYHYYHNSYLYEPNHAFFISFVSLINFLQRFLGQQAAIYIIMGLNRFLFLSNLTHLHRILVLITGNTDSQVIHLGILIFLYNPASIFFHAVYTESIYVFFSFIAIRYYLQSRSKYLSTFFIAFAGLLRSNAIFLAPIVGLNILQDYIKQIKERKSWKYLMQGVIIGFTIIFPFLFHLLFCYYSICLSNQSQNLVCQGNWLGMYSYVQSKYWNVGFLNYFRISNALFIIIGTPSILLSSYGIFQHFRAFSGQKLRGLLLSFVILLIITIGWTNIQSGTRFLSTHPVFYYILAKLSLKYKLVRIWILFYYLLGIFLYTVGYPWT